MFALLDDRDATGQRPSSRRYTRFAREHCCEDGGTRIDIEHEWGANPTLGRGSEDSATLRDAPQAWRRSTVVAE